MIRVGIIGVGTVAQLMHLPILSGLRDLYRIEAITDVSPSLREYIADLYHCKNYETPAQLIADGDVDCVFVCSPDQYHAEYGVMAINAGKHVFIEKPVALCPQDLQKLLDAQRAHPETVNMVGYMRRYAGGFVKCKELLESDSRPVEYLRMRDIILEGDFYMAQTKLPFLPSDVPAACIQDSRERRLAQLRLALGQDCTEQQRVTYTMLAGLGCHTLAAARELFGNPLEVKSVAVDGEHVICVFQYDGFLGVYEILNDQEIVQFDAAIEIYQHSRRMKIKHETPYLRYQPHTFEVIESNANDTRTELYGPDYHDSFENEVRYYHDCITRGVQPKTDLADAMADLELFQRICEKV